MKALDKSNLLFVSFEQAARGHRLARVLATLPNVYWYSHPSNGIMPWNISNKNSSSIEQRKISGYHYNRLMPNGKMLPPPYDYIQKFVKDKHKYYTQTFEEQFTDSGGHLIPDNTYILYCTHSLPNEIREYFPNAKIINIIHDPVACLKRYMTVGLNFPGDVRHQTVEETNEYHQWTLHLKRKKPDLTVKDVWAVEQHGVWYEDSMYNELKSYKLNFFKQRRAVRMQHVDDKVLSTANVRSYKIFKDFINDRVDTKQKTHKFLNLEHELWTHRN